MTVMGGFGGGGGGGVFGGTPQAGSPLAGAPDDLLPGLERLLAQEPPAPEHPEPFAHGVSRADRKRLTLLRLVFEHWRLGVGSVLLVAIVSLANQAGPRLAATAIDVGMVREHSMRTVTVIAALYLVSILVTAVAQRSLARVSGRLASQVMNDLRVRVFTHLQRLSLSFYTREKAGVVMTRMTSDIENLQQLLQDGLAQMAVQALTMVVITVVLLVMNAQLALLMIVLTLPPLLVMSVWFRSRSEDAYQRVRDGIAAVLSDLSESLRGIRVVTTHNRAAFNVARHREIVGEYRDANNAAARVSSLYGPGTQLLSLLVQALLLAVGGHMVQHGSLTLGELVAFFLYFNRFFQPIQLLVQQYTTYQQSRSSLVKLQALLDEEPEVRESDAPVSREVLGEIRLERVAFGYDPAMPVLRGVDLTVSPGETVAFVGPTGAGKSTIAKLVTRLYDVTAGRVLIDGVDVRDYALSSLRHQVGLVPQEAFLFAGTLRDNLVFGRPDATDDEVDAAVAAVGLTGLVSSLPDGLDTVVFERGQSLSAGQRQLVALARAFLARPRVLVLDEATANLDLASEHEVEHALDVLLQGRTAILIAHRLTTAMKADRIVVVEAGRIVESGTHEALVAAGGRYSHLYDAWIEHAGATA